MLGDQIGEAKGKITSQRILDVEGPKIEYSLSAEGRMKEIDITHMATFWTIPRGNGVLHGEGQGVITTKDGSGEMATELGRGIGKITDGGKKVQFRGSFFSEHLQQGSWLSSTISLVSLSMKEMKLEILAKKFGNGNSVAATLAAGGHFQHSIILFYYLTFSNCFIVRMQMKID